MNMVKEKDKRFLLQLAAISAIMSVAIIPIQIFVFAKWQPPIDSLGFFERFNESTLLGLLNLDLLYLFNNVCLIFLYIGFVITFQQSAYKTLIQVGVVLGLIGITTYFSTNVSLEMYDLSKAYFASEDIQQKQNLIAAGATLLATFKGTAFVVYYIFSGVALLTISWVMLKGNEFTKSTAIWGLVSGFFMSVPSVFGTIGLIFALLSLIPWVVFSIKVAIQMLKFSNR